ncbi:MAG: hypothetical protein DMG93_11235 [Acidobacteria bacterium]|nr:MAG: hypothetical protein DMG93_11235 [Acidobacteriota bacterium]
MGKAFSLRVAVITVVIILIFFVVVLFLFAILIWLFPKENIGGYRAIRGIWVEEFWMCRVHAQWYA